jgi:hypothetical protein
MKLQNIPRFRNETEHDAIIEPTIYSMSCTYEELQNSDYYIRTPGYFAVFPEHYDIEDEIFDIPVFEISSTEPEINAPASGWYEETWRKPNLTDNAFNRWMGSHATELHAIDYFL